MLFYECKNIYIYIYIDLCRICCCLCVWKTIHRLNWAGVFLKYFRKKLDYKFIIFLNDVNFPRIFLPAFISEFNDTFVVQKIASWFDRRSSTDTVISASVYCHPGGWCSYSSCGSLFLADGKGAQVIATWHMWKDDLRGKWPSNQRGSRNLFAGGGCFLDVCPLFSWFLSEWRFQKPSSFTSVSSFLLSSVIGQSQLEDVRTFGFHAVTCALIP